MRPQHFKHSQTVFELELSLEVEEQPSMAEEEVVTLGLFEEEEKVAIDFGDQLLNERCRGGKTEEGRYTKTLSPS